VAARMWIGVALILLAARAGSACSFHLCALGAVLVICQLCALFALLAWCMGYCGNIYIYIYIYAYICIYVYICIHICMYTHTHRGVKVVY